MSHIAPSIASQYHRLTGMIAHRRATGTCVGYCGCPAGDHSALGDAQTALRVLREMAAGVCGAANKGGASRNEGREP